MLDHLIDADEARRNMVSTIRGPQEAIDSLNRAIQEASAEHRGHTVVFLPRADLGNTELAQVIRHFRERGFAVDDRCHDKDTFAMTIRWYPAQR